MRPGTRFTIASPFLEEKRRKDGSAMATSARPVALITGASAGIGAALAREAANDGHDLVLVARRREPMEALAAELKSTGAEITVIPADLGKPCAATELMKIVEQRGLAIDTLINKIRKKFCRCCKSTSSR
jgi:NAD(P)-dependent dehydrogenase (short-subunit alcohol dehydrogenase family)